MRIEYLYYFKRLAETLSYTKAAKDLYVAQPTLSVAIKRMEQEYGFALFDRGSFGGGCISPKLAGLCTSTLALL